MVYTVGQWEFLGSGLYCMKDAGIREALLQCFILTCVSLNNTPSY